MSKLSDEEERYLESQVATRAAALHLLQSELFASTVSHEPPGLYAPKPQISVVSEQDQFVSKDMISIEKALQLFLLRRDVEPAPGMTVLEALVRAASEHPEIAPTAPPKRKRGQPAGGDIFDFGRAWDYLVAAGQIATLLELSGIKNGSQERICREIICRTWDAKGVAYVPEDVTPEALDVETVKFSTAKSTVSKFTRAGKISIADVRKKYPLLSNIQRKKVAYEWALSQTEMEAYPEWTTIYKKHNLVKSLSKRSR